MNKAAVIKMVAATKCEAKNWKLDDPQIGEIDADTCLAIKEHLKEDKMFR